VKTVFKYPFFGGPGDTIVLAMPDKAEIVRFAMQGRTPTIWAIVDPDESPVDRRFKVIGTGREIPGHARYLGTVDDGPFVWHGFEVTVGEQP
jgi:hypothetical protein